MSPDDDLPPDPSPSGDAGDTELQGGVQDGLEDGPQDRPPGEPGTADGDTLAGPIARLREDHRDLAAETAFASLSRKLFGADAPRPRVGRYTLERELGRGGMGVVHQATGPRGETVAVKTLRALTPASAERLKSEFRSVTHLDHPNLVAVHELTHDPARDEPFIVMDLVDGVGWHEHLRRCTDEPALRAVFVQLARGVHALHRADCLHRDLKPGNVLVTADGRVVLLDFGLVHTTAGPDDDAVAGTPAYMSPEQASGAPLTRASDWYSLGVLLFEALTGRPLATLPGCEDPRRREVPDPRALAPAAPPALAELCLALLAADPAVRPRGPEILRALGDVGEQGDEPSRAPLLGREAELAALQRAAEARGDAPRLILLEGPSGVGKTAIVDEFLRQREAAGHLVLRGRCHERESVPYKALDGLVDALARELRTWPKDQLAAALPADLAALVQVFPALARVAGAPLAAASHDPQETRRLAFRALRGLLAALARARPLVLAIDDLQWGDLDSARLLLALLAPPDAPACLWLCACRREDRSSAPFLAELARAGAAVHVQAIEPLPPAAAEALALALLRARGDAADPRLAAAIARESGGSPLFVEALIHQRRGPERDSSPAISLDRALLAALDAVGTVARDLLGLCAVAGQPLARDLLRAAALSVEGERAALRCLRAHHLLRAGSSEPGDDAPVTPYHDRIREVVLRNLAPAVQRDLHLRLARALEPEHEHEHERLAFHWHGAGDDARAGPHAAAAAELAFTALAFDRAATHYAQALAWTPKLARDRRLALTLREAEALVYAGRCGDAAPRYLDAAALAGRPAALELRRKAAEQYLVSGRLAEGLAVLRPLARDLRLPFPESPRGAVLRLLVGILRVRARGLDFAPRQDPLAPAAALRLDSCWSAAKGLMFIDPLRAATFAAEGLRLALAHGDPLRIARALAQYALLDVNQGQPRRAARGAAQIARAHALALGTGDPHTVGATTIITGVAELNGGRWRRAITGVEAGVALLGERCVGVTWERSIARAMAMHARLMLGDFPALGEHAADWLREAGDVGDRFATVVAILYLGHVRLAAGDLAGAREAAARARAMWSPAGFHFQHWLALGLEVACDLAAGEALAAWQRLGAAWPEIVRSNLLRMQIPRIDTQTMRATAALSLAHGLSDRLLLLRAASRDADALTREHLGHARAAALLLRAGAADLRGDRASARGGLARAEAAYLASDMPVHAASVRRRRAALTGEVRLSQQADETLRARGVRDPAAFAAIYVAGAGDPR